LRENNWQLTVADSNQSAAEAKLGGAPGTTAVGINVENEHERAALISSADIVISLLPPALHFLVASDCVKYGKDLLTASYVDEKIADLGPLIKDKGLLFICELGLDPGIDHMSAMQLIQDIKNNGGKIVSFTSHCGGLVAPESDDNPWHYKISWNPRNVVMAGKAGASFLENNEVVQLAYEELFDASRVIDVPGLGFLSWYPNRDSLTYIDLYHLHDVKTFIRTTLRYPEFCFGWKNLIDLKLTDENILYHTDGMTLKEFFQEHFNKHGFSDWIQKQLTARFEQTRELLEKLRDLLEAEEVADPEAKKALQDFMMVDNSGDLKNINLEEVKTRAAATVAGQMHEANLSMKQLIFLGMDDGDTRINKGVASAADVLQFAMEKKLLLEPHDKDMIVMLHSIVYEKDRKNEVLESCLVVKGESSARTAMAKTVGLPLGIAAKLILQKKIDVTGLHIPIIPEIYEPVMNELEQHGIHFKETIKPL